MKSLPLILLSFSVSADSLYIGGWSQHVVSGDYNEQHNLIAYEKDDWMIGGFVNSFNDYTVFTAKKFEWSSESWSYGFTAGLSYGYNDEDTSITYSGFTPVIAPYASYNEFKVKPTIIVFGTAIVVTFKVDL